MSDHQKSTSPSSPDLWKADWTFGSAIREPMLLHLPPAVAEPVRALGRFRGPPLAPPGAPFSAPPPVSISPAPGPQAHARGPRRPPGGSAAWLGASGATAKLPALAPDVQVGAPEVPVVRKAYTLCRTCSSH